MAEPLIVSTEEFHDIFGSSDEENNAPDFDGFDIDVEEVESDTEEDENESDSDNDLIAGDTIEWTDEVEDFDIEQFSGEQAMKFNVPENVSPNDLFSQRFDMLELICSAKASRDTASLKVEGHNKSRTEGLFWYMHYSRIIIIIMGKSNLPRITMNWSTNPFIANSGIQGMMTKNGFEEVSQYLHFVDSNKEPGRGNANYDKLFKIGPILCIVLDNIQNAQEHLRKTCP